MRYDSTGLHLYTGESVNGKVINKMYKHKVEYLQKQGYK